MKAYFNKPPHSAAEFNKHPTNPISFNKRQLIHEAKALVALLLLLAGSLAARAEDRATLVRFTLPESSPAPANEGHLLLEWNLDDLERRSLVYQLEQADVQDFSDGRIVYQGPDEGSYISGLPAGSTFFRVRLVEGENAYGAWSQTMEVQVRFPERWKVLLLMGGGTVMFLLLVITIIWGRKRSRKEVARS